jgi:hypothetical protein
LGQAKDSLGGLSAEDGAHHQGGAEGYILTHFL